LNRYEGNYTLWTVFHSMVSIFVGFSIFQMVFLFLIFLLNNVYKENMTFLSLQFKSYKSSPNGVNAYPPSISRTKNFNLYTNHGVLNGKKIIWGKTIFCSLWTHTAHWNLIVKKPWIRTLYNPQILKLGLQMMGNLQE
jgi:hypothetical protein